MIDYKYFKLNNGLDVYVHEDHTTPMAAVNIVYNVGSRDENENKTGFAHLFEHLMFGGSKNIPTYDEPLQKVGGENNAFTSPDITEEEIKVSDLKKFKKIALINAMRGLDKGMILTKKVFY
jgi:zinc protease